MLFFLQKRIKWSFFFQEFAVKIVSRRVDCTREIQLLRACQGHPNIVKLVDVIQVRGPDQIVKKKLLTILNFCSQDEVHTYIVTEYLRGGELLQRIRKNKKFDETQAARILTKLMSAVNFMHFQVGIQSRHPWGLGGL